MSWAVPPSGDYILQQEDDTFLAPALQLVNLLKSDSGSGVLPAALGQHRPHHQTDDDQRSRDHELGHGSLPSAVPLSCRQPRNRLQHRDVHSPTNQTSTQHPMSCPRITRTSKTVESVPFSMTSNLLLLDAVAYHTSPQHSRKHAKVEKQPRTRISRA